MSLAICDSSVDEGGTPAMRSYMRTACSLGPALTRAHRMSAISAPIALRLPDALARDSQCRLMLMALVHSHSRTADAWRTIGTQNPRPVCLDRQTSPCADIPAVLSTSLCSAHRSARWVTAAAASNVYLAQCRTEVLARVESRARWHAANEPRYDHAAP